MTENDQAEYISNGQQVLLMLVQGFGAFLSIMGSSSIIFITLRNKLYHDRRHVYHRIMLTLSTYDIAFSISWLLAPYMQPRSEMYLLAAAGTTKTCTGSVFFRQSIIGSVYTNFHLSLYFWLTSSRRVSHHEFATKYEKPMYLLALVAWLANAVSGVALDGFNSAELGRFCDIDFYPTGCEHEEGGVEKNCTRGFYTFELALAEFIIILVPAGSSVLFTIRVYRLVKNALNAASQLENTSSTNEVMPDTAPDELSGEIDPDEPNVSHVGESAEEGQKIKDVGIQATLYCAAFLTTVCLQLVLGIIYLAFELKREDFTKPTVYTFMVVFSLLYGSQGFLNFFIFIRPQYLKWNRYAHSLQAAPPTSHSKLWALKMVYAGQQAPENRSASVMGARSANTTMHSATTN